MNGKDRHAIDSRILRLVNGDASARPIGESLFRVAFCDGAVAALESIQELAVEEDPLDVLTWEHLARLCEHGINVVRGLADTREPIAS